MKIYRQILFLATAFVSVACTDSFFDLEPSSSVPTDKVYKTADDFNVAVIGCYSKLQGQVSYFTECCEYRSDNLSLSAPTAGTQDRYDIDQFADKASNGILESAWAYFNMYRLWGGIPMTDKVVTVAEALKIGRSSEQQVFDFLTGDLNQVINENMLPSSYTGTDTGRATSGAAMALLGKIYLTFHKWTEARNVLSQLIGRYSLMPTPDKVFDVDNKMNDEIIFAVRFNKDVEGEGHGYWFSIINLTDDTNQTKALKECYKDGDKRKDLITYVKVEDKVCVMNKFKDLKSATYNTVGNDQIILRYADVLLMYAEALNEISYSNSQTSDAMVALNAVHTRAGLSPVQITELADQDSFRKAIMLERQQEFPYEGHRWFDLVRMGGAKEAMKAEGHTIQDFQFLYPIPKTELERINNTELLWQNPGY